MPDVERILQNTPGSLSQQWYESGVAVDPGTVTVGITRADGTVLVAPGTGTTGTGTGTRTYSLTTTHTALLDRLTVTWTSTLKGTLVSYVEVVGGFLFTLSELLAVKPSNLTWTTAQIVEMRTTVEDAVEEQYGTALVPRYERKTFSAHGDGAVRLRGPILNVRSVTSDGTVLAAPAISALVISGAWLSGAGTGLLTIGYEYGLGNPPARVRQGSIRLARQWLVNGPIDDRALGAASPDGSFSFGLATPGRNGSIFGLPDLDAAITDSPYRAGIA